MSKLVSFASFVALLFTAGLAHADPPCNGNNGNGCEWSCSGSGSNVTYHVTCQNTSVGGYVPRCYDVTSGTTTSVPCDVAPPPPGDIDVIDAAFELIYAVEDDIQTLEDELACYYDAEAAAQAPAEAY